MHTYTGSDSVCLHIYNRNLVHVCDARQCGSSKHKGFYEWILQNQAETGFSIYSVCTRLYTEHRMIDTQVSGKEQANIIGCACRKIECCGEINGWAQGVHEFSVLSLACVCSFSRIITTKRWYIICALLSERGKIDHSSGEFV